METEIIPLDFEIYASVNKENGCRIITRLIDAAGNDVTILPAGFDSIPESQFEHDYDEPNFLMKSCRKVCDFFSVIYLVHKENSESRISYKTIRIVYHNETRKIYFCSIDSRRSCRIYPEFLEIDNRVIITNDGITLCNNQNELHLQERKDYYIACIDSRWSLIRRPSLEIVKMSEEIPDYISNGRPYVSFIDDKIVLNMYGESYLCDTTGKLLINGRYNTYSLEETDNGLVWFNYAGMVSNEIDVYDAKSLAYKYRLTHRLPDKMNRNYDALNLESEARNYKTIAAKWDKDRDDDCYGYLYLKNGIFNELIPPIYSFIRPVGDCKAFIASQDRKRECEISKTQPKYGIIDNMGRVRAPFKYKKIEYYNGFFIGYGYNPFWGYVEDSFSCILTPDYKPVWLDEEGEVSISLEDAMAEDKKKRFIIRITNLGRVIGRYYVTTNGAITKY